MSELITMFLTFAKVGVMTFGGGYAMLPILEREVVQNKKWATSEELLNYFAVGQCTPGVIAVNTATFIGYKRKGIAGAIFATAGVVFPSLVIITVLAAFLQNFAEIEAVQKAFGGIRAVVAALIINAVIKFFKSGVKDVTGVVVFVLSFIVAGLLGISPVYVIIGALIVGWVAGKLGRCKVDVYKRQLMGFGAEPQSVSPKGKTDPARVWRAEPG